MSREIINVQVGQAGNQAGEAFWNTVLAEHGLDNSGFYHGNDPQQLERTGVYFDQVEARGDSAIKYVPRSIQVDLEPGVLNRIRGGKLGHLFRPDTYVHGDTGAGNNWAKGYYTEGAEMVDGLLDIIRKQMESCDALQGFQLIHSLGGGTGSGLGTLLLAKIREEAPDRMLATFSILPSPKVSETVVEPYNCILSAHQLIDNSDLSITLDNEALYDIAVRMHKKQNPSFDQLNTFIAQVMCGVSTSLRFPGQLNGDLRKLGLNLVPFPRLHFLMPSYGPFHALGSRDYSSHNVNELVTSLFDRKNLLVACDPRFGKYMTAATIFRGALSSREVEHSVNTLQTRNSDLFIELNILTGIPDNVSIALCSVPPVGQKQAAVCLANSTAIQEVWKRSLEQFTAMYKRKAFMHWYIGEGMDEMEFSEAENNTLDLIAEYQQYQEATSEEMEDEEGIEYAEEAEE